MKCRVFVKLSLSSGLVLLDDRGWPMPISALALAAQDVIGVRLRRLIPYRGDRRAVVTRALERAAPGDIRW